MNASPIIEMQISTMVQLQDSINSIVNPDWKTANNEWYRAIWIECAEMLDHHGWKWWKHQTPDVEQVKLEMVDILHFGLSIMALSNLPSPASLAVIFTKLEVGEIKKVDVADRIPQLIETFASNTIMTRGFDFNTFTKLMAELDISTDDLYKSYVGKNVLNKLRQQFGYKEGTYQKIWDGKEDNVHLVEITQTLDTSSSEFPQKLHDALVARYTELTQ